MCPLCGGVSEWGEVRQSCVGEGEEGSRTGAHPKERLVQKQTEVVLSALQFTVMRYRNCFNTNFSTIFWRFWLNCSTRLLYYLLIFYLKTCMIFILLRGNLLVLSSIRYPILFLLVFYCLSHLFPKFLLLQHWPTFSSHFQDFPKECREKS